MTRLREIGHHYGAYIWAIIFLLDIINAFVGSEFRGASSGLSALLCLIPVLGIRHNYHLCITCAKQTPLDPQASVDKRKGTLQLMHYIGGDFGKKWSYLLLAMYVLILTLGLLSTIFKWPGRDWYQLPFDLVVMVYFYVLLVHSRLQPWCPWCHWDDKGDKEYLEPPTPVAEQKL